MAKSKNAADDRVMSPLNLLLQLDPAKGLAMDQGGALLARKLKNGADVIGTLHEARFVRLSDDQLLLQSTYDGDFDEYFFDFTKHLADVFNFLLEHTIDPPPLPVEKNPQEFADWARERDLVSTPYYSAYPDLTVQDIRAMKAKVSQ